MARNVAKLRAQEQLTVRQLSGLLEEKLGHKLLPSGITKIEGRSRSVDVGDLVALAIAFGVPPNRLLLPVDLPDTEEVALTPTVTAHPWQAWAWALSQSPLLAGHIALGREDVPARVLVDEFRRKSLPADQRLREDHTTMRAADDVRARVASFLECRELYDREMKRKLSEKERGAAQRKMSGAVADLRRALVRLAAEVDDLIGELDGER